MAEDLQVVEARPVAGHPLAVELAQAALPRAEVPLVKENRLEAAAFRLNSPIQCIICN